MPVPRVEKLIINLDTEMPNQCSYAPCDRRSRTPYQVRSHEHMQVKCSLVDNPPPGRYFGRHYWFAFCSEGCRDLWLAESGRNAQDTADRHRGVIGGNHRPGMRGTIR